MTIQDFVSIWQAQPFRAFRMHTARGEFVVAYPNAIALTPLMRVVVVVDHTRVETFRLEDIESCEPFGPPMSVVETISAIPPAKIANNAQLISVAQNADDPNFGQPFYSFDPGKVALTAEYTSDGVYTVQATVETQDGESMFATGGTRWSVHGVEQFENGTSLYLHHLDHPTAEHRIILWPPDKGTFDTFAESMSVQLLTRELHRRDKELATKPEQPLEPPDSYFQKIVWTWKIAERDPWQELFGEEPKAFDPTRYEYVYVPRTVAGGQEVKNPCLTDTATREVLFDLLLTDWDATYRQEDRVWHLSLRHASNPDRETTLHIDVERQGATVDANTTMLPLGWIERHLRNFTLYQVWDVMYSALLSGPVAPKQPDAILSLAQGFTAELWAGEPRFPTPFLQAHIKDNSGKSILDLRGTTWSSSIQFDTKHPGVTLIFSSGEREARDATTQYPLQFDLRTHRVTCSNLEGSTTIGMMQSIIRQVRGVPWLLEEIPRWFEKGVSLPA